MKLIILVVCAVFLSDATAHRYSGDDEQKRVYFITPSDGITTTNPVKIKFGATGINILPSGVDVPDSGHHHLLINVDKLPDLKSPIPADSNHLHFGDGQTETELNLPKGKHTLQLLIGNYLHIPHSEPIISEKIVITIE
jgi:hypothetical protein